MQVKDAGAEYQRKGTELLLRDICSGHLSMRSIASDPKWVGDDEAEALIQDQSSLDDIGRAVLGQRRVNTDFHSFVVHLSKNRYKLPCAKTLSKRLKDMRVEMMATVAVLLESMGAHHAPCLASDCWTSKARAGYFGVYLSFISVDWELVGLPIGLCRVKDGPKDAVVLAAKTKGCLAAVGVVYKGCAGGRNCPHSDPNHTTDSTVHFAFSATTDSGGADPAAGSKMACNALRCTPHCINSVYKEVVLQENPSAGTADCIQTIEIIASVVKAYKASTKLFDLLKKTKLFDLLQGVDEAI